MIAHETHRYHWHRLTQAEQAAAIRRLASLGYGDHDIARSTGWHVDAVRQVLAEHGPAAEETP